MPIKRLLFGSTTNARATDLGLLLLRLFAGLAIAIAHGFGKFPPSERFVAGVAEMGFPIPFFFAWAAALSEAVGGILLAIGLATRPSALMIAATTAAAGFIRHADDPFSGAEKALLFCAVAVLFAFAGAGRYSVDALIRK